MVAISKSVVDQAVPFTDNHKFAWPFRYAAR